MFEEIMTDINITTVNLQLYCNVFFFLQFKNFFILKIVKLQ